MTSDIEATKNERMGTEQGVLNIQAYRTRIDISSLGAEYFGSHATALLFDVTSLHEYNVLLSINVK